MSIFLAQTTIPQLFGTVAPPPGTPNAPDPLTGLVRIMKLGFQLIMLSAALYTLLNLVLAGYMYVTSSGDPKKVQEANQRITYTVIGLAIIVIAPLSAVVIGYIIFHDPWAVINPTLTTINGG